MKLFLYTLMLLSIASCENKTSKISQSNKPEIDSIQTDSILTLTLKIDITDNNIINKSDKQIDLLFNGVDEYLGGTKNTNVKFRTECMRCLTFQEFKGGLLFGKRLFLTAEKITYYKNDFTFPDSSNKINFLSKSWEKANQTFNFDEGKGNLRYSGVSCNDADYNTVQMSYTSGKITVDSLINAACFEYDLNRDNQKEQYLIGLRNCTQELVILRISNRIGNSK